MKRLFYSCLFCFLFSNLIFAQASRQFGSNAKGVIYNKEFAIDFRLHTNGFALGANIGKLKSYYKTTYYHFEIGEIHHPKEFRQSFDFSLPSASTTSRSFIYGKQNNLFVLRAGYGVKRYFTEKARKKGVAVGMSYEFGPSIGILKPYYLQLIFVESGNQPSLRSQKFTPETADNFLNISSIFGSAGFAEGFNELSFLPGGQAKIAVHFDWGAFDEYVKAVEAGIMVDFYFQRVPIMVDDIELNSVNVDIEPRNVQNRPFFINLFLNFQLGKRW